MRLEGRAEATEGRKMQGRGQDFLMRGLGSHRRCFQEWGEGVIDRI